jgi:hypothetical protein
MARGLCDQLLVSERSRALQMNAGANAASGETFWFLHADVEVPVDCLFEIAGVLRDPGTIGGFFRIELPSHHIIYRLTDSFAHYAGQMFHMRCGDHGFFCRRDVFEQIGGFQMVELMEDVEFFRAMRRLGCVRSIDSRLIVSARRYQEIGPLKLTIAYGFIATLYVLGFLSHLLAAIYQRTCTIPEKTNKNNPDQWRHSVKARILSRRNF